MSVEEPAAAHEPVQALMDRWWDHIQLGAAVREEALRELEEILIALAELQEQAIPPAAAEPSVTERFSQLREQQDSKAS